MTQSQAEKTAYCAVFCALAMILSYLESIIPFELIIPLPGFKPGFANIASTFVLLTYGILPAFTVSVVRISLSSLIFGSVTSFCYSLCGGILALAATIIWKHFLSHFSGYIGLGVLSAALHNIGQCICASAFFGIGIIFTYLPYMLLFSLISGAFTGSLTAFLMKSPILNISFSGKSK